MAFKTAKSYTEKFYGNFFNLRDDNDSAEVIFLYDDEDDVLIADTHYIKSEDYSGYVHCCEGGCPACERGFRVQTKLFIPLINLTENGAIQFWDRTPRMLPQISKEIFSSVPGRPSDYVWEITRHGKPKDFNTYYTIVCKGRVTKIDGTKIYDVSQILMDNNVVFPKSYDLVCKEVSSAELRNMLSDNRSSNSYSSDSDIPEYTPMPRVSTAPSTIAPPASVADVPAADFGDDDVDYEELSGDDVTF